MKELHDFCEQHDLPWDDVAADRFDTYVELLEKFNAKMNLIGPLDRTGIIRELFIDSVVPAVLVPPVGSVLDIGTGAGLPGIPLAILYPEVPLTLVEPRKKRSTFLKIATTRLKLNDVEIHSARIEDLEIEPHDWVVSKAFRHPTEWLDIATALASRFIVCLHASNTVEATRRRADDLGLREVAHRLDIAAELGAPVPSGRAVTIFEKADGEV